MTTAAASGTIVLVSGTSGAGKTTITRAFARRAEELYLMIGLDLLVGTMFPGQYTIFGAKRDEGFTGGYGAAGWKAVQAMHEMIAAASRLGQKLVVDHMVFLDPPVLQDCIWRLEGLPVLFVNLSVPFDVVEARLEEKARSRKLSDTMIEVAGSEKARGQMAAELAALRTWFYERAYVNDCFDLDLDTTELSAETCCERIEARLREAPGTAFEELRRRYPRPW
jgi:chloramphenicol 3-O phosphotransferase